MNGTLNKVMLIGNLGRDVEIHYFDDGQSVARFPIATTESYTDRNTGQRMEKTEWHNIVVRNKLAEICHKYLKKGDKVYVEGKIRTREYTDRDGQRRFVTEINTIQLSFLSPRRTDVNTAAAGGMTSPTPAAKPVANGNTENGPSVTGNQEDNDDLPF